MLKVSSQAMPDEKVVVDWKGNLLKPTAERVIWLGGRKGYKTEEVEHRLAAKEKKDRKAGKRDKAQAAAAKARAKRDPSHRVGETRFVFSKRDGKQQIILDLGKVRMIHTVGASFSLKVSLQ